MGYGVRIVGDSVMPEGREWMFLKKVDGSVVLWLAYSSAGCARVLSEAWAAFRSMQRAEVPEQRVSPEGARHLAS